MKRQTREELVITRRGRRALPAKQQPPAVFGRMKGAVKIVGDIVAPTGERWQADEQ